MFNFRRVGQIFVAKTAVDEARLMDIVIVAGADDLKADDEECYEIFCPVPSFYDVETALSRANIEMQSAELAYIPNVAVTINDQDTANKLIRTIEKLEDLEDVKNVFANFEFGDNIPIGT
jgi:transcriptional/translational regulatory protein YebC/TACO1